jgi:zinc protease
MRNTLTLFLLLTALVPVAAQEIKINADLNSQIPVDQNVRIGKLPNGMTYYIRKNARPEGRLELRLAVNAGSLMEDDNQKGLAHFTEHMAFNGSQNFAKNELVNYLQSVGVRFGADLNAYTSFDETVYILPVPTDKPEVVDKGLLVLRDWANGVSLTSEEIDKERGVVVEEWRLGRGAGQRMRDKWFPVVFKGSRYAERLPIGEKEIIEKASYETVRKFYKDWYRPDLQAVIAVGDLDPDEMEKKIKSSFGTVKPVKKPRLRPEFTVPGHEETLISIVTDKEATSTQVQLFYKLGKKDVTTLADFRRSAVINLYTGMLNQRLDELRQSPQPPFVFGGVNYGSFVRGMDMFYAFAQISEDGVDKGLKTLLQENERVRRFGFTPGELDRYKKEMLNSYEQAYKERDKTESENYADEYIRVYLEKEPTPGISFEYEFYKQVLPTITLEEVNALGKEWISPSNRVVLVTGPDKEGVTMPTETDITRILKEASLSRITAYEDKVSGSSFIDIPPPAGKVTARKTFDNIGVTELTLSNGIRVALKPTTYKNDEIVMSGFSMGGESLYPDEDYYSASNAASIIQQSGVKTFSAVDIQKMTAGQTLSIFPYISQLREGFNGSCAPKDLETLLQLVHLYFTDPRKDEASLESIKTRSKAMLQNMMASPQFAFQDKLQHVMAQNHPRAGYIPKPEDLDKIQFERSYDIFRERFNDTDFTFVFVGSFEEKTIVPLLETYLGSLPAATRKENFKDLGIRPPKGAVNEVVHKGTDPKSQVSINFIGEKALDKKDRYFLTSLGEILTIKLIEILREEKGGVYGVGASASYNRYPYDNYTFRISFPCAPENAESLAAAALAELEKIRKNGISAEDLTKIKETQRNDRKQNLQQNGYWNGQLNAYYYNQSDLAGFHDFERFVEEVKPEDFKTAANKFIDMNRYVKVVLMPKK